MTDGILGAVTGLLGIAILASVASTIIGKSKFGDSLKISKNKSSSSSDSFW